MNKFTIRYKVIVISIILSAVTLIYSYPAIGGDDLEEANRLNQKLIELHRQGKYNEAIDYAKQVLTIYEKTLGTDHPYVEQTLIILAGLYKSTNRYAETEPLLKRALAINEKALGKDHLDVALSLNNLARLYKTTGRYAEAEPLYKRSLEIREKNLGKDHPDLAVSLNNLAEFYRTTGRYAEAEPFYKRSLAIWEKALGKDHPDVAESLNNLAGLYDSTGRYAEAEPLHKRALEIREKTLGIDHLDVALSLNNLAGLYRTTGRYAEAEPLYKRSLSIWEKALGIDHSLVATSLDNLAGLYGSTGRYTEAEPLHKRALEIRGKALGNDHPDVATSLNNLAELYRTTGRYAEAEPLYKRSLAIWEKALGKDHPDVATSLNNFAFFYTTTGRYAEAEPLLKRALAINEKALGSEHHDLAANFHNLALLYDSTGRYAEAEPLYKRSLAIMEKAFGKDHPDVAMSLNNLAGLYRTTGRYSEAEPLYKRSLSIWEKALGIDHSLVATNLNNLAGLYSSIGRYAEAEPLYKRSLAIFEKALSKDHPDVAASLSNLAVFYATTDKHTESHTFFKRGIHVSDIVKEDNFLLLNEREKIAYMNQKEGNIHAFISHSVRYMQDSPEAITDTFNAWLKWKGAVAEAQGRYMDAAVASSDPEVKEKFNELNNIRRQIAKMQLSKPDKDFSDYKDRITKLQKEKETMEVALGRMSKGFALEKTAGNADAEKISEILPKDSAYIDFARIGIYNFKEDKWDKPRVVAFILIPQKKPEVKLIDIGDAEEVEGLVKAYTKEMNKIKTLGIIPDKRVLDTAAQALYDKTIKPIEKYISGKKQLFLSPDGNLNLIPFEALVTADNKYLIEKYAINYIAAGRDIVRFTDTTIAKGEAIIIADPDYDMGLSEREKAANNITSLKTIRGGISRDASNLSFSKLPDTKDEGDAIEKILKKKTVVVVKNYQNVSAVEEVIFSGETPSILHLATHGYFLNDEEIKWGEGTRGLKRKDSFLGNDAGMKGEAVNMENPMLRSGIVFSGVNAAIKAGRDEGMVSAEKILGINLKGTDLVVLSACETGVGDVKNGEGVFGLKRAFILSGAKTLVMSLWSVPSKETTEMMTDFYTLIADGKTKSEALRQAKLKMMAKNQNPFYWGAFVMTGKPG